MVVVVPKDADTSVPLLISTFPSESIFTLLFVPDVLPIIASAPYSAITSASLFILINSVSGILGQLTKEVVVDKILLYFPLFLAVLIGGLLGNYLNLKILSTRALAVITSLLVIFVAFRMALKIFL